MTTYTISWNGHGGDHGTDESSSLDGARALIRRRLGWGRVFVSHWFADTDGEGRDSRSCCAYPSRKERDDDQDGANEVWITRG